MPFFFKQSSYSLLFIFLIGFSLQSYAQEESWETYVAKKDKGFMTVTLNMELNFARPNYKNLLIVGTHTSKCLKNGYPKEEGLEKLYAFSDSIATVIDKTTKSRLAGIITYQCAGLDVFYVRDTVNLRKNINTFIQKKHASAKNYLLIRNDKRWKYYQESLFPKDISNDFFVNHELLTQLFYDGDNLLEPRKVEHWLYFRKEKRRQKFIDKAQVLNFKVDSLSFKTGKYLPYELKISREDKIDPESISQLTKMLKTFSTSFYGTYDGWGADLITND